MRKTPSHGKLRSYSSSATNLHQLAATRPPVVPQAVSQTNSFNGDDYNNIIFSVAATPPGGSPTVVEAEELRITTTSSVVVRSPRRPPTHSSPSVSPMGFFSLNENRDRDGRVVDITDVPPKPLLTPPTLHTSGPHRRETSTPITSYHAYSSPIHLSQATPPPYSNRTMPELNLRQNSDESPRPSSLSAPAILQHQNGVAIQTGNVLVSVAGPADVNGFHLVPSSADSELSDDSTPSYYELYCDDLFSLATLGAVVSLIVSIIAGGASALNATVNPSGAQPSDIGKEWWDSLSTFLALYCIVNGTASLLVNYVFAHESIPAAVKKLRKNLIKYPQTLRQVLENILTVTLGTSAAVATAAIAYSAFTWTDKYTDNDAIADIIAATSLLIYFTTRYVGVRTLINRFRTFSDEELILKKQFSNDLTNINEEYLEDFEKLLTQAYSENGNQLNDTTIRLFLKKIIATNEPDFLDTVSKMKSLQYKGLYALEVLFAVIIGIAALPTFTQLGYNGLNILVSKSGSEQLAHLDRFYRGAIGITPGVATAMLYAVSTLDLPSVLVNIVKELYAAPRAWPIFVFTTFVFFNILASGSMQNVAEGVLKKEDRIFDFLDKDSFAGILLIWLNRIGGGITNAKASFSKLFGAPSQINPQLVDVRKYLYNIHIDNRVEPETLVTLKEYSLFRNREAPANDGYRALPGDDALAPLNGIDNYQPHFHSNGRAP